MNYRTLVAALLLSCAAVTAAVADDQRPDDATIARINAVLADMQCEVDPEDIEIDDDGYELDDVFCADGQYDIDLDADLNVVSQRKE
jgi:hypothetical protein